MLAEFNSNITLGTVILGAILSLMGVAQLWRGVKYKTAYEIGEATVTTLREGRDAYHQQVKQLSHDLKETLELVGDQKKTIARLEALPNLERIIHIMAETATHADEASAKRTQQAVGLIEEQLAAHEKRAMERHDRQMMIMKQMQEVLIDGASKTS